ncbi:hypothetical protein LCGC14_2290910, partial [marine sediment metagenome]
MFEPLESRILLDAIKEPYLQAVGQDSIYVLLEADAQSTATVEYGLDTAYGLQAATESTEPTAYGNYVHNIKLSGLAPNTLYHYRAGHGATTSQDYTFRTAPQPGTGFRFGFMADSRTGNAVHAQVASLMDTLDPMVIGSSGDTAVVPTWEAWTGEFFLPEQQALNA